jgi:dTDP-L-rhamnose 4-epimerase
MQDVTVITGGAGFIGRHLAGDLVHRTEKIVAIDNMHPQVHKSTERPSDFPDEVELIVADVRDADFWDRFLRDCLPRTVVHLAAETGTGQSLTESTRHASVNVVGTTQMLDAFTRAECIPDHIVLASSRAVYGEGAWVDSAGGVFYPPLRKHEQLERAVWDVKSAHGGRATPLPHRAGETFANPSSIYGATKLAQEHIVSAWASAKKVPSSIFRFQNVYGPGQSPFNPYTGIITLFHRVANGGGIIDVYEDGLMGRDFVYVADVVKAVIAAIDRPPALSRVLDVGTGVATTVLDAAKLIARMHNAPEPCISSRFRDGDIRWAVADTRDLEVELGIRCELDFAERGVRLVGEWLLSRGFA